jgi:hypothetical protein
MENLYTFTDLTAQQKFDWDSASEEDRTKAMREAMRAFLAERRAEKIEAEIEAMFNLPQPSSSIKASDFPYPGWSLL